MIYIRIELHPGGRKEHARLLSEATIANIGGDATTGEYEALFSKVGGFGKWLHNYPQSKILRKVRVDRFPRKRLYAHDLLFRCLRAAFGSRNGDTTAPDEPREEVKNKDIDPSVGESEDLPHIPPDFLVSWSALENIVFKHPNANAKSLT